MKGALIIVIIALIFSGCNEVADTQRPTVDIESPTANETVTTNNDLRLVATLSDDTGLLQYKLTIAGIDSLNDVGADSTLHLIYVEAVQNGTNAIFLDELIPLADSTFNGEYFATLTTIDVEGNEAIRDTVRFKIQNSLDSTPPEFNVAGPSSDTLTIGMGFSPTGSVTDSQSLIYSDIFIGRTNKSQEIHSFQFPTVIDNAVVYDGIGWYFQVDSTWSQGDYHLYYTAWDNYSGVSHEIPFHVTY